MLEILDARGIVPPCEIEKVRGLVEANRSIGPQHLCKQPRRESGSAAQIDHLRKWPSGDLLKKSRRGVPKNASDFR